MQKPARALVAAAALPGRGARASSISPRPASARWSCVNHVSFLDGAAARRLPARQADLRHQHASSPRRWWVRPFLRLVRRLPGRPDQSDGDQGAGPGGRARAHPGDLPGRPDHRHRRADEGLRRARHGRRQGRRADHAGAHRRRRSTRRSRGCAARCACAGSRRSRSPSCRRAASRSTPELSGRARRAAPPAAALRRDDRTDLRHLRHRPDPVRGAARRARRPRRDGVVIEDIEREPISYRPPDHRQPWRWAAHSRRHAAAGEAVGVMLPNATRGRRRLLRAAGRSAGCRRCSTSRPASSALRAGLPGGGDRARSSPRAASSSWPSSSELVEALGRAARVRLSGGHRRRPRHRRQAAACWRRSRSARCASPAEHAGPDDPAVDPVHLGLGRRAQGRRAEPRQPPGQPRTSSARGSTSTRPTSCSTRCRCSTASA